MKARFRLRKGFLRKVLRRIVWLAYAIPFRERLSAALEAMEPPKRILVLAGAHVGDTVITTSIIPVLRSAYPEAEIGFLVGSWASMVIQGHQDISFVHIVDHWWHNRSRDSRLRKFLHYRKTRKAALPQIRDTGYDLALCVYPYLLPDFMDLAWKAKIPVRLGFSVSLFAPLATATVEAPSSPFVHQSAIQAEVLRPLHLDPQHTAKRKAVLPESPPSAVQELCSLFGVSDLEETRYRIIHVGCGDPRREMPLDFWRDLASELSRQVTLLFTGRGSREAENIGAITSGFGNCVSACDKLSWQGFVAAVRHAEVLYGVESMAGHVAAAVGTRSVVVYGGAAGVARWRPEGPAIVMTNHVPCAPCNLPWGCETMDCMRGITPRDLIGMDSQTQPVLIRSREPVHTANTEPGQPGRK